MSSLEDLHTQHVYKCLQELHAETDFMTMKDFAFPFFYKIGNGNSNFLIQNQASNLDFQSYSSIWHRRPGRLTSIQAIEPWIGEMVEQETRATVSALWRSLKCLWVNSPFNDTAALHKLWQLELAKEIGFLVPETLVTNQPELVAEFYEQTNHKVIYKLISEQSVFSIPMTERPAGIGTLRLRKEDIPFLRQVEFAPHLFQEYVDKNYELRVTVVGQEIFAIKIESQLGEGHLDWRNDYSVPMEPYVLPDDVKRKCLQLMKRLGLNYGAFDLIVTPEDDFVFLEVNCAGQFLWVENKTGLPISLALARLLAGQAEPLSSNQ